VSIEESSQFASALLLCAKHGGWDVKVVGESAEESPYVAMTTKLIVAFPDRLGVFQIEPDASSSSYFRAVGWLFPSWKRNPTTGKRYTLPSVKVVEPSFSLQVDRKFDDYFQRRKSIRLVQDKTRKRVRLSRQENLADSIMTAIVMSPLASNQIVFTDVQRLRLQETERVFALKTQLTNCGARVVEQGDTLTVYPSKLHGAGIETYNDHRMAMCFAILGLKVPGIKIHNPSCVKKTFPNFFQKLAAPPPGGLGVEIRDGRTGRKLGMDELFAD
jgi:3-phosphoshikimate 1-carboxyvinyltransferase